MPCPYEVTEGLVGRLYRARLRFDEHGTRPDFPTDRRRTKGILPAVHQQISPSLRGRSFPARRMP